MRRYESCYNLKGYIKIIYVIFFVFQFVVTMFWSLYLYDRDLVYPRLLDNFIPQWLNHGMVSLTQNTKPWSILKL